jgi:methylglyoxal reductase
MQYREIGQSGIRASVVALGTWAIGGGAWWGPTDDDASVRAIQAALDAGVNLIDTAPVYGWGHSEEIVGRAIRGRREQAILATKCGLWWDDTRGAHFFTHAEGQAVHRSLRPDTIRLEIERSLQRLGTDVIDLYQTHWQSMPPEHTPIADTMATLLALKAEGKIRAIGVSNATPAQMDEYLAVGRIDANQPRYSMLDRAIEADLVPYCLDQTISILAYSPLEQGLLTGKIGMDRVFTETEYRNNLPWLRPVNRQKVLTMLAGWAKLTEQYRCTLAQLVIAWTVAQPGITFALCGARHAAQAAENAGAGDVVLTAADVARMRTDVEALGAAE